MIMQRYLIIVKKARSHQLNYSKYSRAKKSSDYYICVTHGS
jgi:hypothetical protein